ncbi:voltage-gated chloride channel, putative [Bodo saltans]|uniref:Voltage-gated chloride channel, putative n=1 Tax=Bodo saltans TaxID=75058 RepID=A0A0S4IL39_BODSA|nr:voltage-gated chloride channel, putative [Bodo saltans]|eukprot:CUE65228.1 voltage-gated chloride channel, putative [Bodo saltans]
MPPPPAKEKPIILLENTRVEGDWATLDWLSSQNENAQFESSHKHRLRRSAIEVFSAPEAFVSAVVVGLTMGIISVTSDASTHFVASIRNGICLNHFWLRKDLCCAGLAEDCEGYYTWGEFFAGRGNRGVYYTEFFFYVFFSTVISTVASFVCKCYSPYGSGGGIIEVKTIVSGHHAKRYLGGWTVMTKIFACCLSTGSGIQVGKEGPFVHIGACIGGLWSNLFPSYRSEGKKRELICTGSAGGVAVAFGAPIGGVIFALEELSSTYNFKVIMASLICGMVGVLFQGKMDIWQTGRIVQFSVNYRHAWHFFELPLFGALGIFCGLLGSVFIKFNLAIQRFRRPRVKNWRVTEVCILGLVSALFNFFTPYSRGPLLDLLSDLFQDCVPNSTLEICQGGQLAIMAKLILCAFVKLPLWAYAVGCFLPSGVLVPSLTIGGLFGRAFGMFLSALQQTYSDSFLFTECVDQYFCVAPGLYAIVGASAMLTGVTRMTICLAVIMFELTGNVDYLVPVIIGILFAKWTCDAIGVEGAYEIAIEENKLPFLDPKKEFNHDSIAEDVYKGKEFMVLTGKNCTVAGINELLAKKAVHGFPVLSNLEDKVLLGYVTARGMAQALQKEHTTRLGGVDNDTVLRFSKITPADPLAPEEVNLSHLVDSSMLHVEPSCPVSRLLYLFKSVGSRHIMVSQSSHFEGFISKKDLLAFMRDVEHEEHMEEKELIALRAAQKKSAKKKRRGAHRHHV